MGPDADDYAELERKHAEAERKYKQLHERYSRSARAMELGEKLAIAFNKASVPWPKALDASLQEHILRITRS